MRALVCSSWVLGCTWLAACAPADALTVPHARALAARDEVDAGLGPRLDASVPHEGNTADGGSPLYRKVDEILRRSCSYNRCHAGPLVGGGLSLAVGTDYRAALIGVEACEYERMALVEPYAPERSWLMVKLTSAARPLDDPYGTYIYFDPPSGWDPGVRRCVDQTDDGTPLFGQRMPATAPNLLPADEIEIIRAWIAEGAPP